jgi:nitrite reductase (NO-forming)/hydroxylamine reductase
MSRRVVELWWALCGVSCVVAGAFVACDPAEEPASDLGNRAAIEAGQTLFDEKCVACHTVGGGKRTGPDLRNVHQRRDRSWLVKWMKDPIGMSKTDPVGQRLLAEHNNAPMPDPRLDDAQIDNLLEFLTAESGKPPRAVPPVGAQAVKLSDGDFQRAKGIYFNRCAGCHGVLRAGATGPNITPEKTRTKGTDALRAILTNGTPGGMPAWGREGVLQPDEINLMARYVQMDPPQPEPRGIDAIRASWDLRVAVADRPTRPLTKRNWENYFGVILRDAGKVAILDGDARELVTTIDTGFAVHILRSSHTGRYFYAVGRDGRVTMIDLWTEIPTLVAQVQGCTDARSIEASKFRGFEDKLLIEGCYWPSQYVVFDGQTLEPRQVVDVQTPTYDTNEALPEVRVASIIPSYDAPIWLVSLKESGHVAIVDYSHEGFPITARIPAERFLHDGGWDHTRRYFMVAANMRNQMVVIDTRERRMVTKFETGIKPHPGRGANWEDPEFGWVNGTVHIGEGRLTVYGADPARHPEHAWRAVRTIELPSTGGLFIKTHPSSPWVWVDSPLSNDVNATRQICVYSKAEGKIERCWSLGDRGRAVHFEYNRAGTEMWVSLWDRQGELVVFNDRTLEEITRIRGDWLVTPTGKFNVYNTAHDIY